MPKAWLYDICVNGPNDAAHAASTVEQAGGPAITIRSWRDDPTWATAVRNAATDALPKLSAFLGPRSGNAQLTIQEHANAMGPDGYVPSTGVLSLTERTSTKEAVTHRLALLWFDDDLFRPDWMRHGYADWAIHASGAGAPACSKPGPYPGPRTTSIAIEAELRAGATSLERTLWEWERQAGCYIVSSIADEIGPERMQATLATLRGNGSAFASGSDGPPRTKARDWKEWLDIVELDGLVPAGADVDLAARLLRTYGATQDDGFLAARRAAMTEYAALTAISGSDGPVAVTSALGAWDFPGASAAIATARSAWHAADEAAAAAPDATGATAAVRAAVLAAITAADLEAAAALADSQRALAVDVADALAVEAAPRDAIQELGLVGTVLPGRARALDAIVRIDTSAGAALAAEIRASIGAARDLGVQRLAIIVGTVVGLGLLVVLGLMFRRRRRRRRRLAAAGLGIDAVIDTMEGSSGRRPDDSPPNDPPAAS
jgi:hypothetical protein